MPSWSLQWRKKQRAKVNWLSLSWTKRSRLQSRHTLSNWPRMLTRFGPKMSSMNSSKSWSCRRSSRLKSNKELELTRTLWLSWALQVLSCNLLASLWASMSFMIGTKWSPTLGYFVSTLIVFAVSSCTFSHIVSLLCWIESFYLMVGSYYYLWS